ncbi:GntR family transcriptional regulator [Catellatospora sichuanensis]|uniref:GntR family transcriptional regulator n=1 Tax=Catellatospora sichuanensis TaxID=1969805 RepID=UPI0016434EEF|nr:GntR family transcriptional regulator [Catellatospora sichuanensis]
MEAHTSGELAGGQSLPSEADFVARYGVSKHTVKTALNFLKAEGLLLSERGRPWWVRPVRVSQNTRYASGKRNYQPDVDSRFEAEHGVPWAVFSPQLQRVYTIKPATPRIAVALRVPEGADVCERRWIHSIDGVVMRVAWSYVSMEQFGGTVLTDENEPPWPGGTIAMLRHLGYDVSSVHIEASLKRARPHEAVLMDVEEGSPLLDTWRAQVVNGHAVEVARHTYPERAGHVLVFDVPLEQPEWREWFGKSYD